MHGIEAERDAARRVVTLNRLDETDCSLLHGIHHRRQGSIGPDLTEDKRLIRLDDTLPRRLVSLRLIRMPKRALLLRREFLHGRQPCHILRKHRLTPFFNKITCQNRMRASTPTRCLEPSRSYEMPNLSLKSY